MDASEQAVDRTPGRTGGVPPALVGVLWVLAAVICPIGWGAAELAAGQPGWHVAVSFAVLVPMATVGALLAARLPAHPVGWLLLGCAVAVGCAAAASHWAQASPGELGALGELAQRDAVAIGPGPVVACRPVVP